MPPCPVPHRRAADPRAGMVVSMEAPSPRSVLIRNDSGGNLSRLFVIVSISALCLALLEPTV